MISCLLTTFIENSTLKSTCDFIPSEVMQGDVIYEVIKVVDGGPLFLTEHINRFHQSAIATETQVLPAGLIKERIQLLIRTNKLHNGNIRFQSTKTDSGKSNFYSWISPYFYPDKALYLSGIQVGIFEAIRTNPNVKRWNEAFKLAIESHLKKTGFYEILLTANGLITEGSKSNVFFIAADRIITPESKLVLPGVTRSVIIKLINDNRIPFTEEEIRVDELLRFESAFITGTSPGILAIKSIDNQILQVNNHLIKTLEKAYQQTCENDLRNFLW